MGFAISKNKITIAKFSPESGSVTLNNSGWEVVPLVITLSGRKFNSRFQSSAEKPLAFDILESRCG